jgi:hypothetical protein
MEYAIAEQHGRKEMTELVNGMMNLGWRPEGGVHVLKDGYRKEDGLQFQKYRYTQVMVHPTTNPEWARELAESREAMED